MAARKRKGVGNQRPRPKPLLRTASSGESHEMFTRRPKRMQVVPGEHVDHESLGTGLNVGGPSNPQQRLLGSLGV